MRAAVLAAVLLCAASAAAQEPVEPDPCTRLEVAARGAGEPLELEHGGAAGMWMPAAVARHALCLVTTRELDRRVMRLSDQERELWRKRVEIVKEQLELATGARDILGEVIEAASRRAREAEDRADSVLRSPLLWFGTGIVATIAVIVGARWLL